MAFKNVRVNNTKKATDLKVGEEIVGYTVKFVESQLPTENDGPKQKNIVMQDARTGEEYLLFTAGNMKYLIADGAIQMGVLTKITRTEDAMVGKKIKKKSSQFSVEQDEEQTLEDAIFGNSSATKTNGIGKTTLKAHTVG